MNESERIIFDEYESQGFDVIHIGVPDLILLKDGKISFVEIKTGHDKLRKAQVIAIDLLEKHGFKVKIETEMTLATTHARIYIEDMKRLWNLINGEHRTIADVVSYLLDHHDHHKALDDSLEGLNPLKTEGSA